MLAFSFCVLCLLVVCACAFAVAVAVAVDVARACACVCVFIGDISLGAIIGSDTGSDTVGKALEVGMMNDNIVVSVRSCWLCVAYPPSSSSIRMLHARMRMLACEQTANFQKQKTGPRVQTVLFQY